VLERNSRQGPDSRREGMFFSDLTDWTKSIYGRKWWLPQN